LTVVKLLRDHFTNFDIRTTSFLVNSINKTG
jgi:hypothetical protein